MLWDSAKKQTGLRTGHCAISASKKSAPRSDFLAIYTRVYYSLQYLSIFYGQYLVFYLYIVSSTICCGILFLAVLATAFQEFPSATSYSQRQCLIKLLLLR